MVEPRPAMNSEWSKTTSNGNEAAARALFSKTTSNGNEAAARALFSKVARPPQDDPAEDPGESDDEEKLKHEVRITGVPRTSVQDAVVEKLPSLSGSDTQSRRLSLTGSGEPQRTTSAMAAGRSEGAAAATMSSRQSTSSSAKVRLSHISEMMDLQEPASNLNIDEMTQGWSRARKMVLTVLTWTIPGSDTVLFDSIMGLIILINVALMVPETDRAAACEDEDPEACIPQWAFIVDGFLLALYTVELAMRIFVFRCDAFRSRWTVLDMVIVGVGFAGFALAGIQELKRINILRILRVARILRVVKILKRFPTLMNMIGGFVGAMQAMVWGIIMILFLLVAWSLFAVEFINPINRRINADNSPWCADAFSSVISSTLLFFQTLVAGDSWGACAIPIIQDSPWTYLIFAGALVTVQLGFTNLVLAIIVDKAAEAREGSKEEQRAERAKQQVQSFEMWREIMGNLDADKSGSISMQELMEGYANPQVKETLEQMNITKQDLRSLFQLMDHEESGQLSYTQFLDSFYKAQVQDPKIYLMVMQLRMQKIENQMGRRIDNRMAQLTAAVNQALAAAGCKPVVDEGRRSRSHSRRAATSWDESEGETRQSNAAPTPSACAGCSKCGSAEPHDHCTY